jgi:hypothetical protein
MGGRSPIPVPASSAVASPSYSLIARYGLNVIESRSLPFAWRKFHVFSGRQNEKASSRCASRSCGAFGGLFFCRYSGLATS